MKQLVRYDPTAGCFVLAGKKKQYWPGTNIVRSTGNAFDWKRKQQYPVGDWNEMPRVRSVEHS